MSCNSSEVSERSETPCALDVSDKAGAAYRRNVRQTVWAQMERS